MRTPLNRQPAWVLAVGYCMGCAIAGLLAEVAGSRVAAGLVALPFFLALIAGLVGRPDGQGYKIFGMMLLPSLALQLTGWPGLVMLAVYVVVTPLAVALSFDPRPTRELPVGAAR